jgi:hypothetical protein
MNSGCPHCAGKSIRLGDNDLASLRPDLGMQVVDKSLLPTLHITSNKVVLWECEKGHRWETSVSNRVQFGHGCPICAAGAHSSQMEREFSSAVEDMVGADAVVRNDRSVLNGKELDVVIPSVSVAFEFDGVFWHSSDVYADDELGHVVKTKIATEAGFRLIHVWEDTWKQQRSGVLTQVRGALGVSFANRPNEISFVEFDENDEACVFVTEHSMYDGRGCERSFGVKDGSGRIVSVVLISNVQDVPTVIGYAGLSVISEHIHDFFVFIVGVLGCGLADLRVVTDNGFDNGSVFSSAGLSVVNIVEPERMLVGQSTGWIRVPWDDVLSKESCMRKVYTCGKTIWSF